MSFDVQSYFLIFQDAVGAMGAGFTAGAFCHFMGMFLHKGKIRLFIKDVATAIVFTTLVFSYSVSFVNYPVLRWYMVVFALIGMLSFPVAFSKWGSMVIQLILVTVWWILEKIYKKTCLHLYKTLTKNKEKKQKITQKNQSELLKTKDKLMYN